MTKTTKRQLLKTTIAMAPVVLTLKSGAARANYSSSCSQNPDSWKVEEVTVRQYWEDGQFKDETEQQAVLTGSCWTSLNGINFNENL